MDQSMEERIASWADRSSAFDWTLPPLPPPHVDDGAPRNRRERRRLAKTGYRDVSPNVAKR